MFCYQCRYCKVSFGKWGKLVSHKRDEHRGEFEALRTALLLSKQESAISKLLELEGGHINGTAMHTHSSSMFSSSSPLFPPVKKEETMDELKLPRQIITATPPKLSQELDAKDLENQEILLRIPTASLYSSSRPSLYPSIPPSSSFYLSGYGVLEYKASPFYHSSEITPSTRLLSSSLSSSRALTDKNWTSPFPLPSTSAVLYHQMNDDDEMEICVSPSTGYRISITKHPVSRSVLGDTSSKPRHHHHTNQPSCFQKNEALQRKHVVIDELQDELQMSCVKSKSSYPIGKIKHVAETCSARTNGNSTAFAMLKNRGKRLKRLHSQLQFQPPFFLSNGHSVEDDDDEHVDNDNITQRRMRKLLSGGGTSRRRNSVDSSASSPLQFEDANRVPRASPTRPN